MLNPTGKSIRRDPQGLGTFGAPRGKRKHDGIDLLVEPGQSILSPIDGRITRRITVYPNETWYGVEIEGNLITVNLFYMRPTEGIIGADVNKGDIIGTAMDISRRYNKNKKKDKMKPHIHLRVTKCDPSLFMRMP